ncbi:MAG: hypothetical protein C0425_11155 [Chlorobiaceae bacterium]|nr:hypothetical protein [Chlorobiaceae bacterium]
MRYIVLLLLIVLLFFVNTLYAQNVSERYTTSINGTIENIERNQFAKVTSENKKYWATYDIVAVTDAMRELSNLKFYENNSLLFTLEKIPGSDLEISNSGKIIFYDYSEHFIGKLKIHVYSKTGNFLFSKEFAGATLFGFSPSGELMGIRTPEGISIITLVSGNSHTIEKGLHFSFDENDELISVAPEEKILIYKNSKLLHTIHTGLQFPRRTMISEENNFFAVIDKFNLQVYSLSDFALIFQDKIGGDRSFRDLKIVENKIIAGIHKRNSEESTGILKVYNLEGNSLEEKKGATKELQVFEKVNFGKINQFGYEPIPWPFFPFDSMRTAWNHYEQHMGTGGANSYLHQGLDLITPMGEPTYSVINGYVKCMLTFGGAHYWRIAVSKIQSSGWSDGWLSAHLIENTIQFDVGDTVNVHDYLGDIIQWSGNWGHIHFVEIRDLGLIWLYTDNEWGINFNPALALTPYNDIFPPEIFPVFPASKFGFAINETATYLRRDSLFGNIDIIVKVVDYIGLSEWQQPAFSTWYTIKRISDGVIIKPRTLGHILNHKYTFYNSNSYVPFAGVIFQRDNTLLPSSWMSTERRFFHSLTNSNGDSLVELSEKALAFNTNNFVDGNYRIIVEVFDAVGNSDIDSLDVIFRNGNTSVEETEREKIYTFGLEQNYPNPFNSSTVINYHIPVASFVTLKIYDVLGNEVIKLVEQEKSFGNYTVNFDANNLASGIYYYKLVAHSFSIGVAHDFIETKKMLLIK